MKRWRIALIALGAIALALALLAPRDDGLAWIRAYGGAEQKSILRDQDFGSYRVKHRFNFTTLPDGLENDIANRVDQDQVVETMIPGIIDATLKDGWSVNYYAPGKGVEVYKYVGPNWLERQWIAIKRLIGI